MHAMQQTLPPKMFRSPEKYFSRKEKWKKTLLCVESAVVLNYPFLTVMTLIFSVPYMVRVDIHASDASGIVLITWPA